MLRVEWTKVKLPLRLPVASPVRGQLHRVDITATVPEIMKSVWAFLCHLLQFQTPTEKHLIG